MTYAFDTSACSSLFRNFYRRRFPTLWGQFDELVNEDRIVSTREVFREIQDSSIESLRDWATAIRGIFATPTADEGAFVAQIYSVPHFQQNIERQKILKGGKNADPFIVAKAATTETAVVTLEVLRPNAAKIPNICKYFGVPCLTLEGFMEEEGWEF